MSKWEEKNLGVFELDISGIIKAKIVDRAVHDRSWFGKKERFVWNVDGITSFDTGAIESLTRAKQMVRVALMKAMRRIADVISLREEKSKLISKVYG